MSDKPNPQADTNQEVQNKPADSVQSSAETSCRDEVANELMRDMPGNSRDDKDDQNQLDQMDDSQEGENPTDGSDQAEPRGDVSEQARENLGNEYIESLRKQGVEPGGGGASELGAAPFTSELGRDSSTGGQIGADDLMSYFNQRQRLNENGRSNNEGGLSALADGESDSSAQLDFRVSPQSGIDNDFDGGPLHSSMMDSAVQGDLLQNGPGSENTAAIVKDLIDKAGFNGNDQGTILDAASMASILASSLSTLSETGEPLSLDGSSDGSDDRSAGGASDAASDGADNELSNIDTNTIGNLQENLHDQDGGAELDGARERARDARTDLEQEENPETAAGGTDPAINAANRRLSDDEAAEATAGGAEASRAAAEAEAQAAEQEVASLESGNAGALVRGAAESGIVGSAGAEGDSNGSLEGAAERSGDRSRDVSDSAGEIDPEARKVAIESYAATLEGIVENPTEVATNVYNNLERMQEAGQLRAGETAITQLESINKAHREILDGKGNLNEAQRRDVVRGRAFELEDPARMVNQGLHNTCGLQSGRKAQTQGIDPAQGDMHLAEAINTGKVTLDFGDGRGPREVSINAANFTPDLEARNGQGMSDREFKQYYGDQGKRSLTGQVGDAIWGSTAAQLKTERAIADGSLSAGESYTYVTANAGQLGGPMGQGRTGEGLFKTDAQGNHKFLTDSPGVDLWDVAATSHVLNPGGMMLAHDSLAASGGGRPSAYAAMGVKIDTFSNAEQARQKIQAHQESTGQMAQLAVNAPYLRGQGMAGHGLHAMNAGVDANGNIVMDNNWGSKHDHQNYSDSEFMKATDASNWTNQNPSVPWDRQRFGPERAQDQQNFDRELKDPNEKDKEKNEKKEDNTEDDNDSSAKEKARLNAEAIANQAYNTALQQWIEGGRVGSPPDRTEFLNRAIAH